jgi:hypothetical protein
VAARCLSRQREGSDAGHLSLGRLA